MSATAGIPACWVYVAGVGRSGSTLLSVLLARATGAINCGELCLLWARLDEGARCECGAELRSCEVWSAVHAQVAAAMGPDFAEVARGLTARPSTVAKLVRRSPGPEQVALRVATEQAVEQVTGAALVVDASKRGFVLRTALARPRPLVVVHLVRDPRGVAYSSKQAKALPAASGLTLPARAVWRSAALWSVTNARIESLAPPGRAPARVTAVQVTYEDLAADPEAVVARVIAAMPAEALAPAGPGPGQARGFASAGHGIAGNAALYRSAPVAVDRRWVDGLRRRDRLVTNVLTARGRRRYGYAWSPRHGG
jgi:hypothetical protein